MSWLRHLPKGERETSRFAKGVAFVSPKKSFYSNPPAVVKGLETSPRARFEIASKTAIRNRPPMVLNERPRKNQNSIIFAQWQRASDRRRFHPAGQNAWPSNVYGAAALLKATTPPKFATSALPCVDRKVRREVLFAKKKAGTAYYKKKRRTWRSNIHC